MQREKDYGAGGDMVRVMCSCERESDARKVRDNEMRTASGFGAGFGSGAVENFLYDRTAMLWALGLIKSLLSWIEKINVYIIKIKISLKFKKELNEKKILGDTL